MRIMFLMIVLLHGLIHLLGFIKGFGFKEVKELTLPISKPMGLIWLAVTVLFLTYAILYLSNSKYAWFFGIVAVVLSQILIIIFWKDAKIGTIPNILILVVSISSFGYYRFQNLVHQETIRLIGQNKMVENKIIVENDIKELPNLLKIGFVILGLLGTHLSA